jgi:hypothetical protein
MKTLTSEDINARITEIIAEGAGLVTDDQGSGCAGPGYLDAETLDDMQSSDAFIDAYQMSLNITRAMDAFRSLEIKFDPTTNWVQVEIGSNTQGWSQIAWIWF